MNLLVSAGRGPLECSWALAHLVRRLEAEAARRKVTVTRVQEVPGDRPGTYRSILLSVSDPAFAAAWTGTLCWQAPSPFRSTSRKNWYVIAAPVATAAERTVFDEADVEIVPIRTGGPGGQHRNKVSSSVRATHRPTGLVVVADTERRFGLNRQAALRRLRERIEAGDAAAGERLKTRRWEVHDDLIRGNPIRTERP
ncbi:peptide chain release factor-like protein [Catenuloplanes atrovinosus]|uniref:Peptide chain release factor n=1 Tax=Catenuloplanes atrovinosus TaxID=137266 RepID=A0AAE3YQG3_9ACTN|nr:peptide chain release factor-like protein [Catenuloplanes atrovinosus]MDR7276528.1 peptide chain release factor [Catenuloplanes atrovinosus]